MFSSHNISQQHAKHIHLTAHAVMLIICCLAVAFGSTSCKKRIGMTNIMVQDSIRHYYPMLQGQDLVLLYRLVNVGDKPLILNDIQPSCGCVTKDPEDNNVVPKGKEVLLKFVYHSERNTGYVRHTIRIFGNIAPKGVAELVFDTNVVPPALGSPDYEERYKERNDFDMMTGVKSAVDGNESQRGYWTNENEYSRGYNRYYWRKSKK